MAQGGYQILAGTSIAAGGFLPSVGGIEKGNAPHFGATILSSAATTLSIEVSADGVNWRNIGDLGNSGSTSHWWTSTGQGTLPWRHFRLKSSAAVTLTGSLAWSS